VAAIAIRAYHLAAYRHGLNVKSDDGSEVRGEGQFVPEIWGIIEYVACPSRKGHMRPSICTKCEVALISRHGVECSPRRSTVVQNYVLYLYV